jgi:hypothetical protein
MPALTRFLSGWRGLVTGEQLNAIVDRINTIASAAGILAPTNGLAGANGAATPRVWHTGEVAPTTTTTGTDTTPVVTEIYVARVFVAANMTLTGLALLNGSAAAGNIQGAIYNSAGVLLGNTASTAQSGTAAYQQVALTAPISLKGPATYYIAWSFSSTSARFRTHILGNFNAGKLTGQVYGTVPATITPPTTFTTGLGPISDTF